MTQLREQLGRAWCRIWHKEITRPANSQYICLACQRKYDVEF